MSGRCTMSAHFKYKYEKIDSQKTMFLWSSFKSWTYKIIGLLVLIVILSFTVAFTFNVFTRRFQGDQCPLHTKFRLNVVSSQDGNSSGFRLQPYSMYFGQHTYCDYVAFPPIVIGMFSIIWATFFLICGYGSKGSGTLLPKPWRILTPSIIFVIFMTIASAIHSVYLTLEMGELCEQLQAATLKFIIGESCKNALDATDGDLYGIPSFTLYQIITISSYAALCIWIILIIYLGMRCISGKDFQHVQINMHPVVDLSSLQHSPDEKCDLCETKAEE
ncbi:uncharacterized protein LOC129810075 isoform X2 [Phlebotomus papatasi]|uniref:uncharacterized protein LOC129810075 isoform X2 n=1 Tax=Phlebotomus papatasi TaxID=29031 RepID=UPI0024833548|nr:uncharacterized protein LOC129810075 isoform X2 [Phlebotomus papatasi]